jgi:hypothetical protein
MEANMNSRKANQSPKSYNLRIIGSIALVAELLIVASAYAIAVRFPTGPQTLATWAQFP